MIVDGFDNIVGGISMFGTKVAVSLIGPFIVMNPVPGEAFGTPRPEYDPLPDPIQLLNLKSVLAYGVMYHCDPDEYQMFPTGGDVVPPFDGLTDIVN
jgi:hypothetical protein